MFFAQPRRLKALPVLLLNKKISKYVCFFNFRFAVDGFICVYDVSAVPNRLPERQTEFCSQILLNIAKTKKPMVVVATKCDEANEILVRELEKLINRKVGFMIIIYSKFIY